MNTVLGKYTNQFATIYEKSNKTLIDFIAFALYLDSIFNIKKSFSIMHLILHLCMMTVLKYRPKKQKISNKMEIHFGEKNEYSCTYFLLHLNKEVFSRNFCVL